MAAKSDYKWVLSLDTQVNDSQLKQLYSTLSRLGDESTIEFKFEADGKSATKQVNEVLSSINKDLEKKQIDLSKVFELGDLANKIKKDNDEVKELVGLFSGLNEIVKSFAGTDLSRSFTSGTSAVSDLSDRFDDLSEKIKEVKDKLDDIGSDAGSSSGEFYANLSRIDDSLSSISNNLTIIRQAFKTFTDEDTEFSPLFDSINKVTSSIVELKDTVSGVKLNLNLDVGSETSERLNQKTSKVVSRQLEAYQKLYDAMKRTGRLTKEMTLLNTDGMSDSELVGKYRQMIESAEKHYSTSNGKSNIYKDVLGKEYIALKHEIDLANDQLGRVDNKRNKEGLLSQLLGTGDLSGIIQQLENISSILLDIKTSFENGLGIQSSIEKVSELADKVESVDSKLQSTDNTKKIPVTSLISNKSSSDEQISEQNKLQKEIDLYHNLEKRKVTYDEIIDKIQTIVSLKEKEKSLSKTSDDTKLYKNLYDENDINWAGDTEGTINRISDRLKEIYIKYNGKISLINENDIQEAAYLLDILKGADEAPILNKTQEKFYQNSKFSNDSLFDNLRIDSEKAEKIDRINVELSETFRWFNQLEGVSFDNNISQSIKRLISDMQVGSKTAGEYVNDLLKIFNIEVSSNTVVEEQNKLQSELKETEGQAGRTTHAVKDVSSTASQNPTKDAFQENTIPETKGMDQIEKTTKEAVQAKKDFATANEGVQSSIDESKSPLQLEAELMDQIAKSAREAADAKKEFVDANKQVKDSADDSNDSTEEKKRNTRKKAFENVRRISEDEFISNNSNYSSIANNYLKQNGYTILGDSVSTKFTDGLVKVAAKVKDAEGAWKTFSATVDSDTNSLLKPNFTSVTGSVDRLEKKLSEFGKESTHLSLGDIEKSVETVKNALSEKIPNFTDNFNVDVNEKGVVSITQKLKDTATTAKTLYQTFNNVNDAIEHFGNSASSYAERTKVSLKSVQEVASETTKSISDSSDKIIKKANSTIDNYKKFITSDAAKRASSGNEFGIDYINARNKAENIISELNAEITKYANSDNNNAKLSTIRMNVEKLTESLKSQLTVLKNTNKGVKGIQIEKMLQRINKLKSYTGADFGLKKEVDDLEKNILSLGKNGNSNDLMRQLIALENKFDSTNNAAKSFLDTIKEKTWYSWAGNLASMFSIYDVINLGRTGIQVITDLDTAFTEMKKVSDETTQSLKNFQSESFALADQVGSTAKTIQDSTADWMRLGESLNEAKKSASTSNILFNVSEFDNISDATDSLVAMSQAYKDLDKLTIVDKLNEIGNNYSISTDELAQGLQKSAATLSLMGNTIDESAALITTANSVIRDADSVSAGLRTISLRLVGTEEAEEELSAMNEEVDAFVKATNSKKQQIIKDYTSVASNSYQGFDILDENGNYKNTYEILLGIAKIYKEIQEQDKKLGTNHATALVEELAGKNRSNIAAAILQDPEQIESVLKSSQEAAGSAQKELNSYLDSIEGRTQKLQNKAQEFWYRAIDTDVIKDGISLLTNLLDLITSIVDKVGLLPPLLGTLGAVGLSHSGLD